MCKSVIHINNENCKLCKLNLIIPIYLNLYTILSSTQSSMRLDMTDMNPRPEQPICLLSSEEQLRCDAGWAVWDLGKGGWRRVFHFTQLPWEIPAWEGVRLHYRRWGCHPFLSRASRRSCLLWSYISVSLLTSLPFAASPRQCIDLFFDDKYSIEPSWECKFDHIEVRDGPFGFSPLIGRYCGQESPAYVRSSGRYLYIKFVADGELEAIGFSARYNFTQGR